MDTMVSPFLVGMVHLPALPGSPGHELPVEAIIDHARREARTLVQAGFDAVIVENFGDGPFFATTVEPVTVAAMAVVVSAIVADAGAPVGVNCLRNDATAALGIAAATGAQFIRVNVLTGVSATDQGFIEGDAARTLRLRRRLCPEVKILADVHVKHAVPLSQPNIGLAAEEIAYRGRADALVVSGATTGRPADLDSLRSVKAAVPDRPVLVGSGATAETAAAILEIADGVIIGSSLKPGGDIAKPIDAALAAAFVRAARR